MPKYSVKKPFTILVAVILVLVLGFVSLTGIQTDLLPAMNLPYLMVITTYPGASPEQVEADVTKPLENALSTLNGVKNVTSQSNENYSLLFLEYQDDTDMDSAMVKASTAVNQLGDALPDMASTPTLMEISPDMMATQYIAVDYDGMDIYELSDYVSENVLPQLERVDGVASVSTTGLVEKSVQITLDQEKIDAVNDKLLVKVSDRLADAKKELDANKKKINDGMKELDAAQAQLDAGKAQLNSQKADVTTQLRDAITELDKQIRIAFGEKLRHAQKDVHLRGHAMECRINAEDPLKFIPSPGRITTWHTPGGPGVRIDSHVYQGYFVPPNYDSMIGKIITYGDTREQAIARMRIALSEMVVEGIHTNIPLHQQLMVDAGFVKGGASIHHLEHRMPDIRVLLEKQS